MQAFCFDRVDSTNDAAKRLLAEHRITADFYVVAREQTAGRGTQGRRWLSPRDAGIYLSLVRLDAGTVTPDTALHTLAAGVGCAEAIEAVTDVSVRLKAINDLIADGGKLGGILTEMHVEAGLASFLITGIGINVRHADRPLPADALPARCLEQVMSAERFDALNIATITTAIVEHVRTWQDEVVRGHCEAVRRAWQERKASL